jgi:hypothetical protein
MMNDGATTSLTETDALGRKYSDVLALARKPSVNNKVVIVGRLHAADGSWTWKMYAATGPASREAHQAIRDDGKRWEPVLTVDRGKR